jgi:hypothetical protein
MRRAWFVILTLAAALPTLAPRTAAAQGTAAKPSRSIEINWGFTQFLVEDEKLDHTELGGGFRMYLWPQLAVGAEVTHLRGPGADRDWVFAGKGTWDLMPDNGPTPRPFAPYAVASGGVLKHADEFNEVPISKTAGFGNGGVGVRIALGRTLFLAPEFRYGFEKHWHVGLIIGIRDTRSR